MEKRASLKGIVVLLAIVLLPVNSDAQSEELMVMTRNLYVGVDIFAVVEADNFLEAAGMALNMAAASYRARVDTLAAEIVEKKPHLVALQEVYDLTFNGQNVGVPFPFIDFLGGKTGSLEGLLVALKGLDADYKVAASVKNLDISFGFAVPILGPGTVRVIDRDVILVRGDVTAESVDLTGLCRTSEDWDGCHYGFDISPIPIPFPPLIPNPVDPDDPIVVERGLVAVHADINGFPLIFVNTHLETRTTGTDSGVPFGFFQSLQAQQLIGILDFLNQNANPDGVPIVLAGDFNSDPRDAHSYSVGPLVISPPYKQLGDAGYLDLWALRPGNPKGFTCCQEADLRNEESVLYERVDLIFTSEEPMQIKANVVGNDEADKTPSGLWPSDHAGVAARIKFQ